MKARQNYKAQAATLGAQLQEAQGKLAGLQSLHDRIKVLEGDNQARENRLGAATVAKQQLKALLGDAYDQIAAQRGYIDRALEDDAVREVGPSREQFVNPTPKEPRRMGPQPMMVRSFDNPNGEYDGRFGVSRAREPQPRPWHSL